MGVNKSMKFKTLCKGAALPLRQPPDRSRSNRSIVNRSIVKSVHDATIHDSTILAFEFLLPQRLE
jgi:hypothetical protein